MIKARDDGQMKYWQARIVWNLARDQQELKKMNGWYGDPAQGLTTEAQDLEALKALEDLGTMLQEDEKVVQEQKHRVLQCQMSDRIGELVTRNSVTALNKDEARAVTNFWGCTQDYDVEGMERWLNELREL